MIEYRYKLINKPKITCPSCRQKNRFSRYFDNKENVFLSDEYGRCDREINCGYHKSPKNNTIIEYNYTAQETKEHNIVPKNLLEASLLNKHKDNFSLFLIDVFGEKDAKKSLSKYYVGCSKLFDGNSTVWWQIAKDGVRTGKIMKYDGGKRVKGKTSWVHYKVYKHFNLKQVFFGNHLTFKPHNKRIVITESEKSAVICDVFFNSDDIFIASGMLRGLQEHKFGELIHHNEIVLLPDWGKAYNIWVECVDKLNLRNVRVSNSLQKLKMKEGEDVADAILEKKIEKSWIKTL